MIPLPLSNENILLTDIHGKVYTLMRAKASKIHQSSDIHRKQR
jgi:hypothetical protein